MVEVSALSATTLAPQATATAKYSYTVTQADVDAGKIINTVTASGNPPTGDAVTDTATVTVTTVKAEASISVDKTADKTENAKVGDVITYTITVTNDGNVTLTGVALEEALKGVVEVSALSATTLAPQTTATASYKYTVTQADVDAGKIVNTVTASGNPPTGEAVTDTATVTVTTVKAEASISVDKTADKTENVKVGDVITYTITVTNDGNVTLTGVALEEALKGVVEVSALSATTLAPQATATAKYSYTVTQTDVDAGKIVNTVTASGNPPTGEAVTDDATVTVTTVAADAKLTVEKTAEPTKDVKVGDKVKYTVVITNSGNVTVKSIELTDSLVVINEAAFELAPAASKTITYEYTVTQKDVDAGKIDNTAIATGKDPAGGTVTASDDATVTTVEAKAALTVTKTASKTAGAEAGDVITYTVTVENTGNVTVKGITLDDTLVELDVESFDLAPGEKKEDITYTYTVTQDDIDAGSFDNTVTATGKDPKNNDVSGEDTETVKAVAAGPELTVTKTAVPEKDVKAGDKVTYTVTVENTGNVTVTGITLSDTLVALSEAAFELAPKAKKTITYEYTVTQADVDAGKIDNTATATGKDPAGKEVTASDDAEVTTVKAEAALTVEKTAEPTKDVKVGDKVKYTVVVTNSGNVTVTGIVLADTLVALTDAQKAIGTLAPAESKTITYEYTVTQKDVDAGKIDNTATATGKDPKNAEVTASDDATVTTVAADAKLTVTKTAKPTSGVGVGDEVEYTVVITNSGNVTVTAIALSDSLVTLNEAAFALEVGASKTITYKYTVTQADVDAGEINNTVTATGKDPKNADVTGTASAKVTTEEAEAKLTVTKKANPTSGVKFGDKVTYTVTVTNSGNVTVSGIKLSDTLVVLSGTNAEAFDLAPTESKTITYEYTVIQNDVDTGKIDNTVTAIGKDPKGTDVTGTASATVTTVAADAALTVVKTADPASGAKVGDEITYTVVITNSGNVTIKGIALTDTLVTLNEAAFDLAVGTNKTITYKYTVTQADVDAGKIDNTATATGKDPAGKDVTGTDDATVTTVAADAKLTVEKTAAPEKDVKVGDKVTYTVVVTNSGNVTVTAIALTDTLVTLSEEAFDLAPGANKTITYEYTVTQADVDAGKIDNTATATGKDPAGKDVTASDDATVTTVAAEAALTVEKTAKPTEGVKVGDKVTYTVVVTNSGNVTVTAIALADTLVELKEAAFDLAPGASKTVTYEYTVTQADVDAGKIDNTATATGKDPAGKDVTASDDATVTTVAAEAALTVEKTAKPAEGVKVGDKVTYTVVVTNSGNVTVTGITLEDTLVELDEAAFDLAPAASKTITYEYTVTQKDVDAGKIDNTATATGKDPKNADVTASDDATVTTVAADAKLTVEKTAKPTSGVKVGDKVAYTVVVTNSGNVTVTGIVLADTLVALTDAQKAIGTLAPAESKTITYEYTVTQKDVDAGKIDNTATATGKDPKNADVTASDDATVTTVEAAPALTVDKTAEPTENLKAGDKVTYTVVVTNSGNVTVTGITLADTLVTINEAAFDLAPGANKTITYEYTVTQADVDAGKIDNTATATGKDPKGNDVTAEDTATVTSVAADAKLSVTKTAAPASGVKVGDEVEYTVVVTNSGNVTIKGITLADTLVELKEAAFDLAPAASKTITYTYTVTQADVDAGKIDNTVTATGKDPKNNDVTGTATATVTTVEAAPALTVTKTADPAKDVKVGDEVTYTVVITNSGNVTVTAIALADTLVELKEAAFDLAPAGSKTITYKYTVTQADVDAGKIDNTVTATGKDPKNNDVTGTATATVTTVEAAPALTVEKTAEPTADVKVGDKVKYTVVVTNSGNVTITAIELEDTLVTLTEAAFDLAPAESKTVTYEYTVTQADVDAGKIDNTVTATGKDPKGNDVTDDASVTVKTVPAAPELTVTKTADKTSGVKAGEVVTYTVTVENTGNVTVKGITLEDTLVKIDVEAFDLAPGEKKVITYTYTVTEADVAAGKIDNAVTATGKDPGDDPVPGDDTVTVTTEVIVTITENSGEYKYDGTEKSVKGYTVKISNPIYTEADFSFKGNDTVKGTDAGIYEMLLKPEDFSNINEKFSNVTFVIVDGTLEIIKRTVILTSATDEKVYDGTALTNDTVTVTGDGWAEGEGATYDVTGTITDVGSVENEFTYKLNEGTKAGNYTIELVKGTLTITPVTDKVTVTITENSDTVEYDGKEHTIKGYKTMVADNELYDVTTSVKETETAAWTVTETKVGTYDMGILPADFENINKNFTNVEFVVVDGQLEITPYEAKITVTADDDEKLYDGTPLSNDGYTVDGELPEGHTIEVVVEGTITNAGEEPNEVISVIIRNADGEDVTDQFADIVKVAGTLTVNKRQLTLTSASDEKVYDGTPLTNDEVTISGDGLAPNETITFDVTGSQTQVGSSENTFTYEFGKKAADTNIFKRILRAVGLMADDEPAEGTEPSMADNYDIAVVYGTLTVTEPEDDSKVIKKAHEDKEYGVGDTVKFTITVTNIYDEDKDITIEEIEGVTFTSEHEFKAVKPGETVTATAEYVLTEADIYAGTFKNTATAKFSDIDKPYKGEDEVPTEKADPHMTVVKEVTSTPADGSKYEKGETIEYKITVKNDGNLTIEEIEVADDLTGDKWTIESLAPGEEKVFTTSYVVTEKDAAAGKVVNVATADGHNKFDDDETPNDPGTTETPVKSDTPKTGDDDDMRLYGTIMAGALGCMILLLTKKRRKEEGAE
ncbi:MAG: DUF11 domain-containing protein [Firmicutes bacterium]|nr:DUF11 domain-containing protein [Bacillota bacterium]